jgi:hypothetical protein
LLSDRDSRCWIGGAWEFIAGSRMPCNIYTPHIKPLTKSLALITWKALRPHANVTLLPLPLPRFPVPRPRGRVNIPIAARVDTLGRATEMISTSSASSKSNSLRLRIAPDIAAAPAVGTCSSILGGSRDAARIAGGVASRLTSRSVTFEPVALVERGLEGVSVLSLVGAAIWPKMVCRAGDS